MNEIEIEGVKISIFTNPMGLGKQNRWNKQNSMKGVNNERVQSQGNRKHYHGRSKQIKEL